VRTLTHSFLSSCDSLARCPSASWAAGTGPAATSAIVQANFPTPAMRLALGVTVGFILATASTGVSVAWRFESKTPLKPTDRLLAEARQSFGCRGGTAPSKEGISARPQVEPCSVTALVRSTPNHAIDHQTLLTPRGMPETFEYRRQQALLLTPTEFGPKNWWVSCETRPIIFFLGGGSRQGLGLCDTITCWLNGDRKRFRPLFSEITRRPALCLGTQRTISVDRPCCRKLTWFTRWPRSLRSRGTHDRDGKSHSIRVRVCPAAAWLERRILHAGRGGFTKAEIHGRKTLDASAHRRRSRRRAGGGGKEPIWTGVQIRDRWEHFTATAAVPGLSFEWNTIPNHKWPCRSFTGRWPHHQEGSYRLILRK